MSMAESVAEGFAALAGLVQDESWASRLRVKAVEIAAAGGPSKDAALAKAYLEAEGEAIRRSGGRMQEDEIRRQMKPIFAKYAQDYPGFNLLFAVPEAQLIGLAGQLMLSYAAEIRPFIGRRASETMLQAILEESGWGGIRADLEAGIAYDPVRFRTMQESIEVVSLIFGAWYRKNQAVVGAWPNRRAFERAYLGIETDYGFLPALKNLLGATPLEVLGMEKAKRLHELETETTTQARSIRAADEGLRRQAERLQRTVTELEETRGKLEVTSQAKSVFIDVVSHQFRTPLSSVRWNAELLYDELASKESVDPAHKEAIANIRTKSVYLIETLDRVFTTLEVDTGTLVLDKKKAFLWEIVQDVYGLFERDIQARGLQWKFKRAKEQIKELPLDKNKITSALKIIIGNAVAYNKDGGKLEVDIRTDSFGGKEYLVCSVSDEGLGIPPGDQGKFFDKFYRSRPAVLKVADGTGLGNYIVKNVVEAHGGWVRVESGGEGKGMTVSFGLPTA